jgi:hypothetical protein
LVRLEFFHIHMLRGMAAFLFLLLMLLSLFPASFAQSTLPAINAHLNSIDQAVSKINATMSRIAQSVIVVGNNVSAETAKSREHLVAIDKELGTLSTDID